MALTWPAKAPGDVYRYTWAPALADGDSLAGYTVSASGAVIDYDAQDGDSVVLFVSGGAANTTAVFTFSADSSQGETLTEAIYLPIRAATLALGNTARDVCYFALRKVAGNGVDPSANELSDALERLNGMLAAWKDEGADVGAVLPLSASTALSVPDAFIHAIRNNLILQIADLYDYLPSLVVVDNARRGIQKVKSAMLSDDVREAEFF